jgi:hypothetical protein
MRDLRTAKGRPDLTPNSDHLRISARSAETSVLWQAHRGRCYRVAHTQLWEGCCGITRTGTHRQAGLVVSSRREPSRPSRFLCADVAAPHFVAHRQPLCMYPVASPFGGMDPAHALRVSGLPPRASRREIQQHTPPQTTVHCCTLLQKHAGKFVCVMLE